MNKKALLSLGTLSFTLLLACTCVQAQDSRSNTLQTSGQASVLAAKDIYDAFKNNKTKADEEYRKKTITVRGFAVFVGPDIYALPSIELSEKKDGEPRMLCVLPLSDYLELRKVSKGQEVTITGEIRTFYDDKMVLMKNARIIE